MKNVIIAWATSVALGVLRTLTVAAWDAFWSVICDAVREAERDWDGGDVKKAWVTQKAISWLEGRERLGVLRRWAVKMFIGRVVDEIIEELNESAGHNWVSHVKELKVYLEGKLRWFRDR